MALINFPINPSNGQVFTAGNYTYTYNSTKTAWLGTAAAAGGAGIVTYETLAELPLSGNDQGAMAYVEENNRLYMWTGVGWFNIALINTSPTITGAPETTYSLSRDGTPTVITLTASDPEGLPITWSYSVTTGSLGSTATVAQDDNEFTITPSTDPANSGNFGITFTASDGINIATAVSSFTLVFSSADTNYNKTILFTTTSTNNGDNNTFVDSSTNNFTVTRTGNVAQGTFSPYSPAGWSGYFDGANDYISISGAGTPLTLDGDFTVEFWIHPTTLAASTGYHQLIMADNNSYSFKFFRGGSFYYYDGATAYDYELATTAKIQNHNWYHIAWVRSGNSSRVYINGISTVEVTTFTGAVLWSTNLRIGGVLSGAESFPGYISNVRVVKGTRLYTANFTPPEVPLTAVSGTSLLTLQDGRLKDNSTNNFAITKVNDVKLKPISPFVPDQIYTPSIHGGSAYFDGTGDYLTTPSSTAIDFGTGDFTIETWVYFNALSTNRVVLDRWATGNANAWQLYWRSTGTSMTFLVGSSTILLQDPSSTNIAVEVWNHIAVSRSGTTVRLFVNGIVVATATSSLSLSNSLPLGAGVQTSTTTNLLNGYLSGVRIVKGTALYTSSFTPPAAPLTAVSGTGVLLNFTGSNIYDETGRVNVETIGNVKSSTAVVKYGDTSMAFDGSGDYLSVAYDPLTMDWWTSNYTIEAWVYPTSFSGWSYSESGNIKPTLIGNKTHNTTTHYWGFGLNTSGNVYFGYFNGSSQGGGTTSTATLNAWNHIALVINNGAIRVYLNGTGTLLGNISGTPQSVANTPLTIGAGNNAYINGYVQDLRITKGVARYTANFTPPTARLGFNNAE